jgi:F0F1-type ATP synthase epsilon subunit|tara:strand:- start:1003 stop:1371 length:369 start_codon:yes stop_codon:yes gene_type:complete
MTIADALSVAGGVIFVGGTSITIFKKSVIDPLAKKNDVLEQKITELDRKVEKNKEDNEANWKKNSEDDQKLKEAHIKLEAKHDNLIDINNQMNSKLDKIFEMLEKRSEVESRITERLAKLEK